MFLENFLYIHRASATKYGEDVFFIKNTKLETLVWVQNKAIADSMEMWSEES